MLGGLFGESWDDPRTALTMGLAQGLLGARSIGGATFGDALAAGIGQGIPAYQQARQLQTRERLGNEEMRLRGEDSAMRRQEFESRIAEAKRKQAEQEAVKAQLAAWVQTLPPEMQQLAAIAPEKVIDQFFKKDEGPLITKPGDILRDRNNPQRVVAENPAAPDKDPEFIRIMRMAGIQEGSPEWKRAAFNYITKQSTHAPASSQNVYTGTMVPAEVAGKQVFVMPSKDGGYTVLPGVEPPGAAANVAKEGSRVQGAVQKANTVIGKVDDALGKVGFFSTGLTGAGIGQIPGTGAYDLRRDIDTIKANVGFQTLQEMRDASPTGGALGQVAVQELDMLQATIANLDAKQSEAQLRQSLGAVRQHYTNWKRVVQQASPAGSAPAPGGGPKRLRFNPATQQLE